MDWFRKTTPNALFCSCLDDVDDEVRDRAALYLRSFKEKALADAYVREGEMLPDPSIIILTFS